MLPNQHVTTPRLEMSGIRKAFGATLALEHVQLVVQPGEVHALIGENGAGKSTLMKVLSGAIRADAGAMHIDGQVYAPPDPHAGRNAGVAMIYQELSLAPHLTVMENVMLGVEPTRGPLVDWDQMRQRATVALAEVGRPDINPAAKVYQLSLAEQQLVEVARSVAIGCRILVLDEPTSSVTARDVKNLFELIERLRAQGISVIYVSHFLEEVEQISDRFTILRDGRTVATGKTQDVTRDELVREMVGRQVEEMYPRSPRESGEVLLSVTELEGIDLPRSASLELRRGEVVGIAGLVGSGRTELLRAVFGLDEVQRGEVRVAQLSGGSPRQMWLNGTGLVSEDRKQEGLALSLSIADNLTLPHLRGLGPWRFVLPQRQHDVSSRWVDELSIRIRDTRQAVGELSGGNQQKVALARLLHADVDVLLLDEPTRGIDVGSKAQIYGLIDKLVALEQPAGAMAKAVLVVSSYLPELMGICDRIAVMTRGHLGRTKPVEDRNVHEIMVEAIGGDAQE